MPTAPLHSKECPDPSSVSVNGDGFPGGQRPCVPQRQPMMGTAGHYHSPSSVMDHYHHPHHVAGSMMRGGRSGASQLAALFDDFMQFGSVGLHIVDNKGIIVWANQAELDLLGYLPEEYIGRPIADFHADPAKIREILSILLSGKKLANYVAPIKCRDGHIEYVEINSSMRQHNGKCVTTRCFSACVTDRVLREQAQIEAAARRKEAEFVREETRRKTDFLRKLCHELRNPLTGVTGNLDLLMSELLQAQEAIAALAETLSSAAVNEDDNDVNDDDDEKHDDDNKSKDNAALLAQTAELIQSALECADSTKLAAEHQRLVINDTLSLSKLESTGFEYSPTPVDLQQVIDSAIAILGIQANEKGLDLKVGQLPTSGRFVRTDPSWLKQIVLNLLTNALKFTTEGHVHIGLKVEEAKEAEAAAAAAAGASNEDKKGDISDNGLVLEISVEDTGIGMTREEQGKLFGVFSQANERISAQFGGSGLGLHIIKQLLDNMGGTIAVRSEKGAGSTFTFRLPCGALDEAERQGVLSRLDDAGDPKRRNRMSPLAQAEGVRVLVVDDSQINRKILTRYLSKRGYDFDQAENGRIALEMHSNRPFDIILTDIDMPVMNGLEMTRLLREQERQRERTSTAPVAVIGISGYVFPEDVEAAECSGINEYICKPYKFPELDAMMGRYLIA